MKIYNNNEGSTGRYISTSKGNQLKMELDNKWYKADYLGYEGASEYFSSNLLSYTNITSYVNYELTEITYNDKKYNGCVSDNFLSEGEMLVTAEKLFKLHYNCSVDSFLKKEPLLNRIEKFVEAIEKITNLDEFGEYLTAQLEFDRLILNEDRHFRNIAVIKTIDGYDYCPVFDNGAAMLSDMREDYPLEKSVYGLIPKVTAKPFDTDFDKQVEAAQSLYGSQLKINVPSLNSVITNIRDYYGDKIADRMDQIYEHQYYLYKSEHQINPGIER